MEKETLATEMLREIKAQSPVGTVPVYGNQPIFTCPNNGCGCNGI